MNSFYNLTVKEVNKETQDAVSVTFSVPQNLEETFSFQAGQYLTLEKEINGEKVRRAYSICKAPFENEISVLIKEVSKGKFSTFANKMLKSDDVIDVMPPEGNFKLTPTNDNKELTFFAAGSGITPIISMIKAELNFISNTNVVLFYVNKTSNDVIFKEELRELEKNNRLTIHYIYTREETSTEVLNGRINKEKCKQLEEANLLSLNSNSYLMCGPEQMILNIKEYLLENKVNPSNIHFELFTTSTKVEETVDSNLAEAKVFVTIDDDEFEYSYKIADADSLLDAGIEEGLDLPFSCKGGVCCTCKAKILKGKANMAINYALTESEVEEGYILTCQAHPTTKEIIISFDE